MLHIGNSCISDSLSDMSEQNAPMLVNRPVGRFVVGVKMYRSITSFMTDMTQRFVVGADRAA